MAEKIDPSTVADRFSEGEDFLSLEQLASIREEIAEAKHREESYSDMIIMYPRGLAGLAERLFKEVMEAKKKNDCNNY